MFKNIFNEWASRSNNVQNEDYDAKKDHNMNPTSHVKKEGDKFCVYNVKGEKVKSFDTEAEANAYAKKNHDALMKKEGMTKSADRKPETYRRPDGKMGTRMVPTDKEVVKMKEAMDAVDKNALKGKHKDRKDKDIDNDGDVDSSDKYLHKRRKAISKSMKKGKDKEGDVEMNPKLDKGSKENSVEQKESTDESYTDVPKVGTSIKQKRKNAAHDKMTKRAKARATANVLKKMNSPSYGKGSNIREKLLAVLENKQTKGATPPETMDDKLKGKGAKDMVNQPKEIEDVAKGHDDVSKAGKVTKPAKARNGGDQVRSGDQGIVNKVVDALKGMK